ncbi:MAG: class I SAM-dependent methyltransferase [Thermodesulfovibrionales bacterium]|nr:class I SAM-dependent methyltransferase [Thermodesulfovibrionales bacterium]
MNNKTENFYLKGQNPYYLETLISNQYYAHRIVELSKGARSALELGIGYSITTEIFKRFFKRYCIIDSDRELIKDFIKQTGNKNIEVVNEYFEDYHTKEKFDVIIMGFVLEHVDDPTLILNKYKEFLSDRGKLFITVPNATSLHRRIAYEAGLMSDMYVFNEVDIKVGHKRYFDVDKIKALVKSCGYDVVKIEGIFLKPITTSQMVQIGFNENIYSALLKIGKDYPELSNSILVMANRR